MLIFTERGWRPLVGRGHNGPKDGSTMGQAIPAPYDPTWIESTGTCARGVLPDQVQSYLEWDPHNVAETPTQWLKRKGLCCGKKPCIKLGV